MKSDSVRVGCEGNTCPASQWAFYAGKVEWLLEYNARCKQQKLIAGTKEPLEAELQKRHPSGNSEWSLHA